MNKLQKEIERAKSKLIKEAEQVGLYENFGQRELNKLYDKHIKLGVYSSEMNQMRNALNAFDEWCMNYTGK